MEVAPVKLVYFSPRNIRSGFGFDEIAKLGVPTFSWYGNHLQIGRSHFQLVWKSITNLAFPLSAGMETIYKLAVPTFIWYGNQLQTGRSHFQLVNIYRYIYIYTIYFCVRNQQKRIQRPT